MRPTITGYVITFNGQLWLHECLKSMDFCDKLLVVDSGSTDDTLGIAQRHGAEIVHRDWTGHIDQHKFALGLIDSDWVITLDQDEVLSDELKEEIQKRLNHPGEAAGYYVRRSNFYFNRFMRHSGMYPDWLFRVFKRESIHVQGIPPHEELRPIAGAEPIEHIEADILHYPYQNFSEQLDKINSYTRESADALYADGKRGGVIKAFLRGFGRVFKRLILQKGYRDGKAGFILATYDFFYVFQKYLLIEEKRLQDKRNRPY